MTYNEFQQMLRESISYEMQGNGVLELTGYFSGKRVKIDLSMIDEETFEQIVVEDEQDDDCEENDY